MGKADKFWNASRIETMEREWLAGVRASIIARHIGHGCTKNMVIGKAARQQLPRRRAAHWSGPRKQMLKPCNPPA